MTRVKRDLLRRKSMIKELLRLCSDKNKASLYKNANLNALSFLILNVILVSQIAMFFQTYYSELYEFIERLQFSFIWLLAWAMIFAEGNELLLIAAVFLTTVAVFIIGYVFAIRGKTQAYYIFAVMCVIDIAALSAARGSNSFLSLGITIAFKMIACAVFTATALTAPKRSVKRYISLDLHLIGGAAHEE